MSSHRRRCAIFSASFSTLISLAATATHAQLAPATSFNDNGAASDMQMPQLQMPSAAIDNNSARSSLQTAQAQVAPAYGDNSQFGGAPVRPASFNPFSSPGGPMQATDVQHPQAQLRDAPGAARGMNSGIPNSNGVYPPQAGYRNTAMQQPAYPQVYPNQQQQLQQQQLQQYQQQQYQQQQYQQQLQQQMPAAQLRNQPGTGPVMPPGVYQTPVVSGDPRFVSPPPAAQVGNFATSPYRGPYRTVAYQLPQQSPQQLPVQPPSALPNQPQVVPQTSTLPQFQPTVGQLASYQALQPGYNCAPNIPSNGVPAYVPGAVVPPTLPPNMTPQLYTPDNAGYRPLFSLGQENYNVQLGRGIIGQPTVYVSGQPIRNFLRYISP